MALRQLAFVATQYCEEHSLAPMDEDGSVFVIWFADVEAAIPLSRMALRQLAFVATQYCEEHSLAPMDEDGSVFVIGFREDGATLVPEIQSAGQLPGLIDEILRIVRPEL